jgi:S-adenosylmethionine:tRNA ribosyltransferase-isomerase
VTHTRFDRITEFLVPGDLLVFNSSRTLPATLVGTLKGSQRKVETRLAELLPDGAWLALLLPQQGKKAGHLFAKASVLDFGEGLNCGLLEQDRRIPRLWKVRFSKSGTAFLDLVYRIGQPIRCRYLSALWRFGLSPERLCASTGCGRNAERRSCVHLAASSAIAKTGRGDRLNYSACRIIFVSR